MMLRRKRKVLASVASSLEKDEKKIVTMNPP
jgi:hypothetical protein